MHLRERRLKVMMHSYGFVCVTVERDTNNS